MNTILRYIKNYKLQSVLSPLFKLLESVFELIVPIIIASIIDIGIANNDFDYILKRVLLLALFAFVGFCSAICAQYFAAAAACGVSSDIRGDLFHKIIRLSVSDYENIGSSNVVTGLTSDVNQIQSGINLTLRLLLRSPFIVFGAVIMAFTIDVKLSSIFVIAVFLLGVFVAVNMRKAIPAYKNTRKSLSDLAGFTENSLSGVKVIRGFNRTENDYRQFSGKSSELNKLQKYAARISAMINPITFLIINIAICVLIYSGSISVNYGNLSQGQVVALYNYMSQILVELIKLANLIVSISRALACASRVDEMFKIVDESISNAVTIKDPHHPHSIVFKNVSFTYQGNSEETLNNISFEVKPGEKIGIIGLTGSGKSTIAQLASGLYDPNEGDIFIDDISIGSISRESLYESLSLCLQKAKMFSGSIKYNISLDRDNVNETDVLRAVTNSCTDDVIASKTEGIDYEVSSNGAGLSGGQKQRIGIARALAGNPGIIIFDDSTSALDSATEKKLMNRLRNLDNSPTMIFVSQKIKTIMNLDKILLIEDGKVVDFAPHSKLYASSENYRKLCRLQREEH